ncbi:MAG: DUF4214 domain-containing protein [Clostridiales bacterium]|nr:DUF4214 domain-containing protein [Clostridiales bacterium]
MKNQNHRITAPICKAVAVTGIVTGMLVNTAAATLADVSPDMRTSYVRNAATSDNEEFEAHRTAAMRYLIGLVPTSEQSSYATLFDSCYAYLNGYSYDDRVPLDTNIYRFDQRVTACEESIRLEMDHRTLEAHKQDAMIYLVRLVPTPEQSSYATLFDACYEYLNGYRYDDSVSLDINISRFDQRVHECEESIRLEMDQRTLEAHKQEAMRYLTNLVPAPEQSSYAQLFDACYEYLNGYRYDDSVSLDINRSRFDQRVAACEESIRLEMDHRTLEVHKQEAMRYLINLVPAPEQSSYAQLFDACSSHLNEYSYDDRVSLDINISRFDRMVRECEDSIRLEMDHRALESHKEEAMRYLISLVPSSEQSSYAQLFDSCSDYLNGYRYDDNVSFDINLSRFDHMLQECEANIRQEMEDRASSEVTVSQAMISYTASYPSYTINASETPAAAAEASSTATSAASAAATEASSATATTAPAAAAATEVSSAATAAAPATTNDVNGFVDRLYTVALGRESDPDGRADWVNAVTQRGETGADLARGFLYSSEFLGAERSNEEFVTILYSTFFNRAADSAGLASWVNALENGATKQQIIEGFINSTEWANLCVAYGISSGSEAAATVTAASTDSAAAEVEPNQQTIDFCTRLYTTCLGRQPDQEGLMAWARQLANHRDSGSGAARGFFFSSEISGQNLSNEEYLTRLYRTFMNREPDEAGFNAWLSQLNDGVSREEIFSGFVGSQEFTGICDSYGIERGM